MTMDAKEETAPWRPMSKQKTLTDESDATLRTERTEDVSDDSTSSDYSDVCSDEEDSDSEYDDLERELLCFDLQQMRRRNSCSNKLSALLANSTENQKPDLPQNGVVMDIFQRMEKANATNAYFQDPTKLQKTTLSRAISAPTTLETLRPDQFLKMSLATQYTTESTFQSKTWESYFTAVSPERMAAHNLVVASAIRKADLPHLRTLLEQGARLDGCNRQGESSMHLACRMSQLPVIQFLMEEAQVSVRVRDDCGKTPLHDVCWTNTPNFDVIHYILDRAPELLWLEDHRGYTALHYVPASASKAWCEWIENHQEWLQQKVHNSTWLKASDDLDKAQARMQRLLERTKSLYEG